MKRVPSATMGVGPPETGARRIELLIDNLDCPTCGQTVEQALRSVPGVVAVTVNRASGVAFVDHDPARTSVRALHEALKGAGYGARTAKVRFRIRGMTCASCVTAIEQALRATPGVMSAHVSLGSKEALVEYVPVTTDLAAVKAAVGSAGYPLPLPEAVCHASAAKAR